MGTTLNRSAYQRLVDEDLEWLAEQPRGLERGHIEMILRESVHYTYDEIPAPHRAWADVHFYQNAASERSNMQNAKVSKFEAWKPPESKRTVSSDEIKTELRSWARSSIMTLTWKCILFCILVGFLCSALLLWTTASDQMLARIQTFNGALTIPVGALTWAFAFTFVFLVPMKAMQILMAKSMLYSIEAQEELVAEFKRDVVEPLKDGTHPGLDRLERAFSREVDKLVHEIRNQRKTTEGELDQALAEGEAAAREIGKGDGAPPG